MTKEHEQVCDELFSRLVAIKNDDDFVREVVLWASDIEDQRELIRFIDEEPDEATPEELIKYAVFLGTDRDGFWEEETKDND